MSEEKVHTPTVVNQTYVKSHLEDIRASGAEVINIYRLLKDAEEEGGHYRDAYVLGLSGNIHLYQTMALVLGSNTWKNARKLGTFTTQTDHLIRTITQSHMLIYLLPPAMMVFKIGEVDVAEEYSLRMKSAQGFTEREFWTIWYLCKTKQINTSNVTVVIGAHHAVSPRHATDTVSDQMAVAHQMRHWKQNIPRSPMNKDYGGAI